MEEQYTIILQMHGEDNAKRERRNKFRLTSIGQVRSISGPYSQRLLHTLPDKTHSFFRILTTEERDAKRESICRFKLSERGVTKGFPLELEVEHFVTKEVPFNPDFLKHIFPKIEWKALHDAAQKMGVDELPEQVDVNMLEHEDFLRRFHHALLELHLEEGALICPETGRRFPVSKGIPNMLLHEDEV